MKRENGERKKEEKEKEQRKGRMEEGKEERKRMTWEMGESAQPNIENGKQKIGNGK